MKNRALKLAGYILFGIFLFCLLVYARFPREKTIEWLLTSFENHSQYNLIIKDLHPLFPLGLDLENVEITAEINDNTVEIFQAKRVTARIQILPLLVGNRNFKFSIDAYNGAISGTAKIRHVAEGRKTWISAEVHDVKIPNPLPPWILNMGLDVSPSGMIKGNTTVVIEDFDTPTLRTDGVLTIEEGKVRGIKIKGMPIKEISCEGVDWAFELIRDKMDVKKLSLYGKDLELNITGQLVLEEEIGESPLHLMLRLKPKGSFERNYRLALRLFKGLKDEQGYFSLPINGTLESPKIAMP